MGLKVIGAGFGRTGTESMKQALEMLSLGPCYHMREVLPHPDRIATWLAAADGTLPDWNHVFADYASAVDWPAAFFWRELAEFYPDAKVLLTVRGPESWYASMDRTLFRLWRERKPGSEGLGPKLIGEGVFSGNFDHDHAIALFEKNTADVESAIPPDRLLKYNVGDGWEPLCRFLGRPVPDAPYPHSNSAEEFNRTVEQNRLRRLQQEQQQQ